jgi:hypothetical protein
MTKKFKFFVKESQVTPYSPLNHTGTVNRRLEHATYLHRRQR